MMKAPFSGGCTCGAIRYECAAEPVAMIKCHCRYCQRATGGAFAPAVLVPTDSFKLTRGTPRYYLTPSAAGGRHQRGFCADCGSRLTGGENPDRQTGVVGVNAGSLDDPGAFLPEMDIWVSDAQPWDHMDPKLPKFETYPPSEK